MATYERFLESIGNLRKNVATFRKVVLHSHSPNSHDYGKSIINDTTSTLYNTPDEFSKAVTEIDVNVIALTDHMKCGLACEISKDATSKGKCVLPGMEVSLRFPAPMHINKLHLIVIFPENCSLETITKILPPGLPDDSERTGLEVIDGELQAFVSKVHGCGGICIAAHVDSTNGIRKNFRQIGEDGIVFHAPDEFLDPEQEKKISEDFKEWLLLSGLDAIELSKSVHKSHYRWVSEKNNRKISVAAVLRNDAHRIEEIDSHDRINYIKMTSPTFSDLKLALEFPLTRIRFHTDLPRTPCPRILGIEIVGAEDKGFFNNIQIAFSDNLTCLIGPRGSGKSTIIEAIRYTFGLNKYLDDLENAGKELADKAKDLQNATLTECMIRIAYIDKNGQTRILETTYDPKQDVATRFYDTNGDLLEVQDIETSFPLRLFGWSEIETLGRESHRQRELLDQMIEGFTDDTKTRARQRQSLSIKKAEIDTSIAHLENILNIDYSKIKKYKEFKSDFDRLNTEKIQNLFRDIDLVKSKIAVLTKYQENLNKYYEQLLENKEADVFDGVTEIIAEANDTETINVWWNDATQKPAYESILSDIQQKISASISILKKSIDEIGTSITQLTKELNEKEKIIREEIGEEDTLILVGAERRRIARERLDEVETLRRDYIDEWVHFTTLLGEWNSITCGITSTQKVISEKRNKRKEEIESQLNLFSNEDMKISISFSEGLDRAAFSNHLTVSGILSGPIHGQWKLNQWPVKIALTNTPVEFAECLLNKDKDASKLEKVIDINGNKFEVDKDMANTVISTLHPFSTDIDAEVPTIDKMKLTRILTLGSIEWDDSESISLNNKPVSSCSPGQRSSAMLPLIALAEDIPLIIDQPEDNLDNRLVGKMLIDIITGLKEHRQIIVATHNPNIVVSGDAEQVIVLDAESDTKGIFVGCGSIDKDEIISAIIDIMEGGKEAFINRSKRYHIE